MIRLDNLECKMGSFRLNVNLTVNDGEYFIILGPNGAGKTVLLETIAGFNKVTRGSINIDGENMTGVPPEKRGTGIVYQDDSLFPHLTVRENVTYGLRVRKKSKQEIEEILARITNLTSIEELLQRKPGNLSGGEKRRVSLARSLSVTPKVLLLDEPLSALDPEMRDRMVLELKTMHRNLGLTTLHVCHDFSEAISLGDRIAVMEAGAIRQIATPRELFRRPNSEFVARFTMAKNIFKGRIGRNKGGNTVFYADGFALNVLDNDLDAVFAAIRPEDITLSEESSEEMNCFRGSITGIIDKGQLVYVIVDVPPDFVCQANRKMADSGILGLGKEVYISFRPDEVSLFNS
jgi:ABC-type Fe3+/spermidine/putrescine transport system ATPase subunit